MPLSYRRSVRDAFRMSSGVWGSMTSGILISQQRTERKSPRQPVDAALFRGGFIKLLVTFQFDGERRLDQDTGSGGDVGCISVHKHR